MAQTFHLPKKRTLSIISAALLIAMFASFAAVLPASADAACTWAHHVRPGDTLGSLAHDYGTTVSAILAANPQITSASLIFWGTDICISDTIPVPPVLPDTYTVNAGDTLSLIAFRYGVTVSYLAKINGLGDVNLIYAGEKLEVPAIP